MDGLILNKLVRALDRELSGGRITRISYQKGSFRFSMKSFSVTFHLGGNDSWIEFSENNAPFENTNLSPFVRFLQKRVAGGVISCISAVNHDRVVEVSVEKMMPLGLENLSLYFEMIDGRTNCFLTRDGEILQAYKAGRGERELVAGDRYEPPQSSLPSVFVSPLPRQGRIAYLNTHRRLEEYLTGIRDGQSYEQAEKELRKILEDDDYYACTMDRKTLLSPVLYPGCAVEETYHGVVSAVNSYYGAYLGKRSMERARGELVDYVKALVKKQKKILKKVEADLSKHAEFERYKKQGDLILTYGYSAGKYDTELNVTDPETGEGISITINPAYSPGDNAALYYKRYTRGKRALARIRERMEEVKNKLDYYSETVYFAEKAGTLNDVRSIGREVGMPAYTDKQKRRKPGSNEKRKIPKVIYEGYTIYYGRSAAENDYVSIKAAAKDDIWMHVRNMTGAQVVIRCPNKEMPGEEVLSAASQLAVYMSKARGGSKVAVDVTKARHVRKPKGVPTGLVLYDNFTTLIVDQDIRQVKKILGEDRG